MKNVERGVQGLNTACEAPLPSRGEANRTLVLPMEASTELLVTPWPELQLEG